MTSERARCRAFDHARILTLATLFCQRGLCELLMEHREQLREWAETFVDAGR